MAFIIGSYIHWLIEVVGMATILIMLFKVFVYIISKTKGVDINAIQDRQAKESIFCK